MVVIEVVRVRGCYWSGGSRRLLFDWSEWDVFTQEVEVESGHQIGGSRNWSPE